MTTFSRKSQTSFSNFDYSLNNSLIERQALVKDLAIIFDAPLRFAQCVNYIVITARKSRGGHLDGLVAISRELIR